jgi:hypothetical protein
MAAYRERESRGAAEEVLHKTVDARALCRAELRVLLSSLGFLCTFLENGCALLQSVWERRHADARKERFN